MSHTPGPWTYNAETDTIRSQAFEQSSLMGDYRGVIVCDLEAAHGGKFRRGSIEGLAAEIEANARLIAAAPELLNALMVAKVVMEDDYPRAAKAIAKVIAKATGGGQ